MEIVTENGKDYLVTYVAKIDNSAIDANALFTDLQEAVDKIIKAYNTKHKTKLYVYIHFIYKVVLSRRNKNMSTTSP